MQINAGVKKDTVTAFAYHEDTADHLESDAIKSEPVTSTINLNQVRELSLTGGAAFVGHRENVSCTMGIPRGCCRGLCCVASSRGASDYVTVCTGESYIMSPHPVHPSYPVEVVPLVCLSARLKPSYVPGRQPVYGTNEVCPTVWRDRGVHQVADIDMVSRLTYVAIDLDTALAGVGEPIEFEVTMVNGGNVDIDNTVVSNELFKNDAGECFERRS